MKIINLTPHTITLINGETKTELVSEGLARVTTETVQIDTINGIPVNTVKMGEVIGLPEKQPNTILIVSRIVAEAIKNQRDDVLIVDKTVRDENGRIIGATALAKV